MNWELGLRCRMRRKCEEIAMGITLTRYRILGRIDILSTVILPIHASGRNDQLIRRLVSCVSIGG